jgi:hypothetical protein
VVFCDLDNDVIHLGMEDGGRFARVCPPLPEKDVMKLKTSVEEQAVSVYLKNWNTVERVTYGQDGFVLPNSKRST